MPLPHYVWFVTDNGIGWGHIVPWTIQNCHDNCAVLGITSIPRPHNNIFRFMFRFGISGQTLWYYLQNLVLTIFTCGLFNAAWISANLRNSCYNVTNDQAARVLFAQHPLHEQDEWLRQNARGCLYYSACSFGCWMNNALAYAHYLIIKRCIN